MKQMIADINITEKSFGPKVLMTGVKFSVDDGEKVGVVGRNGIGKSTLFGILTGADTDYTGEVIFKRGVSVVATAQEHHGANNQTVMEYILQGLPEYAALHHVIKTYPAHMGDDLKKITEYTAALERFGQKGFYQVEELVAEELKNFQMDGFGERELATLSGGQKRLVEVVKIMHADADLALLDEPTNHMDYVAKKQFIDWLKSSNQAMLVITHDRDVLREVGRIIELKDGGVQNFKGNYDAYLKQNAVSTGTAMNDFEMVEKRMVNLKQKVLDYQRLKEKSRNPGTIQRFKRLENMARAELLELEKIEKPTFWIDKDSAENLNYKVANQYQKFKAKNIRLSVKNNESRSKHVLVKAVDLALGYGDTILFEGVNIDLREGEAVELRGRNGAGKSTLIRALLGGVDLAPSLPLSAQSSPLLSSQILTESARKSLYAGPAGRSAPSFEKSKICSKVGAAPPTVTRLSKTTGTERHLAVATTDFPETELSEAPGTSAKPGLRAGGDGKGRDGAGLEGMSKRERADFAVQDSKQPEVEPEDLSDETLGSDAVSTARERYLERESPQSGTIEQYCGEISLDPHVRVGVYEQEIGSKYLEMPLAGAIEKMYMDKNLPISTTKTRQLMADYLFTENDGLISLARLSGGQKARFQLISMLANEPQLLILDEPTNHLDLPSIEELETALQKYSGAILYVSHDSYFREKLGGQIVQIGT